MRMRVLAIVALAACGEATSTPSQTPAVGTAKTPPAVPPPWLDACLREPGDYGAACGESAPKDVICPTAAPDAVGLCGIRGVTAEKVCQYPDARCQCTHESYCGGPAPSYLEQNGMQWQCANKPGPGDCPLTLVPGHTCSTPDLACGSGGGCGRVLSCVCRDGAWECQERMIPPQP